MHSMPERPTIAFRVDESQKEEWQAYAATNPEYDSLSHLIRTAVAHEMSNQYGPSGRSKNKSGNDGTSEEIGELVTTVEKMAGRMKDMEEELSATKRTIDAGGGVSEDTLSTVVNALPRGEEGRPTTAEGVAEGLDLDADTVRVALEQLHENTGFVVKQEIERIKEGNGTTTVELAGGRDVQVEDADTAFRRRNPLWWRK